MYNRLSLLGPIHKGIRYGLSGICFKAGSIDFFDKNEVSKFYSEVSDVCKMLEAHSHAEDDYVQPLYEKYSPIQAQVLEKEHEFLDNEFLEIERLVKFVSENELSTVELQKYWFEIVDRLHIFTAAYFTHLKHEESEPRESLLQNHTDEELLIIGAKMAGSIEPSTLFICLRYMIPAMNRFERIGMFTGMKKNAPPQVLEKNLSLAQTLLSEKDFLHLKEAIDKI